MSPRNIISKDLIDWASDDEVVEGEDVIPFSQMPLESYVEDDDSLQQPTNITNEPTNQMEVAVSYTHLTLPTICSV